MTASLADPHTEAVRRFNRFYSKQLGLLQESYLKSSLSLTEVRVLYELAHREATTATEIAAELGLDLGYLSRLLGGLEKRGLIGKRPAAADRRQSLVSLTDAGRTAFAGLNAASADAIDAMLHRLPAPDRDRVVQAMHTIESLLGAPPERRVPYLLRPPHSGDFGWVVQRHGVLYRREHGWNEQFEALVAEVAAEFVQQLDPERERGWIAERDGENVGSVFLVKHREREAVARLRLLLVEPAARGLGIGRRLVQECTRFARAAGYRAITLWTDSSLHAARRLYEREGYRLVSVQPHHSFGHDLVGETWELAL
jgi:DNA-binding MarR family transcriptional regulator/GNAT superfamily N-acetyltransferase